MRQDSNTFGTRTRLSSSSGEVNFYDLKKLEKDGIATIGQLPYSIRVLLESVLRNENGVEVTHDDVLKLADYFESVKKVAEIPFNPSRVLLQDFTGVPALVDLAALRSAMASMGGDPKKINPLIPADLVIDHSVQVDYFASHEAFKRNAEIEFERNRERYEFLHWGQKAFENFRVVPPASGICHQVNLEYLANVVQTVSSGDETILYPDTLVGTDSHTTMINGLGVLGWGVGGIEAEAAMLGQPLYMLMPEVIGFKLTGELPPEANATDLVLTVTQILRKKGVVSKFVEYYGAGLSTLTVPDRATLANMSPEYGATMGFFPVDGKTLEYLRYTGRPEELIDTVERYCKEQGLFRTDDSPDPEFVDIIELDLSTVEVSIAGPKRPQDKISLKNLKNGWMDSLTRPLEKHGFSLSSGDLKRKSSIIFSDGSRDELRHGDVLISAITSCTNTSNPSVMIGAGILAKKAVEAGLLVSPKVKTSLAPGSKVVTDYLTKSGLLPYLEKLGFHVVGYGCTTCIGNSGPLPEHIGNAVKEGNIIAASVLSGNRNFSGRINPHTKASFLMSPQLVVALALAGTVDIDFDKEPIGKNNNGKEVFLKDILPDKEEIEQYLSLARNPNAFRKEYDGIDQSNETWNRIQAHGDDLYGWNDTSTYIQEPPFFLEMKLDSTIKPILGARVLVKAGDSVTTDHISPAGAISDDSPAGSYLQEKGIEVLDFNSYGSRRGNDRVMTRGTFANVTFRNELGEGREGSWTTIFPEGQLMNIYDAADYYRNNEIPVIVIAGKDYGMGSSRDWAAKGTLLLGVKAVIAESFERIHRSNLVGMGVLPLQFKDGESANTHKLTGSEIYHIKLENDIKPRSNIAIEARHGDGSITVFEVLNRLDSEVEVEYYRNGGILHTVLKRLVNE